MSETKAGKETVKVGGIDPRTIVKWNCISIGIAAAAFYFVSHIMRNDAWWARPMEIITKPVPVLSCIALLILRDVAPHAKWYARLVLIGQVFSVIGDICLLYPSDTFLLGVVSFLVGHIFYMLAFGSGARVPVKPLRAIPFAAHFIIIVSVLWDHLGEMRLPAALYTLVIDFMAWRAAARFGLPGERIVSHFVGLLGVCMFIASDSTLAVNKVRSYLH